MSELRRHALLKLRRHLDARTSGGWMHENGELLLIPGQLLDRNSLVLGCTGSGKSVLVDWLIADAARRGQGAVVIDPYGQHLKGVRERMELLCPERLDDIVDVDIRAATHACNPLAAPQPGWHPEAITTIAINWLADSAVAVADRDRAPRAASFVEAACYALAEANMTWAHPRYAIGDLEQLLFDSKFRASVLRRVATSSIHAAFGALARLPAKQQHEYIEPVIRPLRALTASNIPGLTSVYSPGNDLKFAPWMDARNIVFVRPGVRSEQVMSRLILNMVVGAFAQTLSPNLNDVKIVVDEAERLSPDTIYSLLAQNGRRWPPVTCVAQDLGSLTADNRRALTHNTSTFWVGRSAPASLGDFARWPGDLGNRVTGLRSGDFLLRTDAQQPRQVQIDLPASWTDG